MHLLLIIGVQSFRNLRAAPPESTVTVLMVRFTIRDRRLALSHPALVL